MTTLTLGGVTFKDFEIPERINFGGDQSLAIKQLVGGKRIVDSMGRIDDDISWSGLMQESDALERAQLLDSLRVIGAPMPLVWSELNFIVVIRSFKANYELETRIPYSISVTVIQDLNKPFPLLLALGYTNAVASLLTEANFLAAQVANPNIVGAMAALSVAIAGVGDLTTATPTQLTSLLAPLNSAQSATTSAINSLSTATFGGG